MKINFRAGVVVAAAAGTALGFAGTNLTTHATDVRAVQCPASPASAVAGNGSSLQNAGVQAELASGGYDQAAPSGCGSNVTGTVAYTSTGSGTCIGEADANSAAVQFCGTDVPYAHTDFATMNSTGWGKVQTIAIALSAVDLVTSSTNCAAANGTTQISGQTLAQIFAGVVTDWHTVNAACAAGTKIDLGARTNSCSGTTQTVKNFFEKKDATDYATTKANHPCDNVWPAGTATNPATAGSPFTCNASTNQALVTCTSTDANLLTYVDESDAAARTPGITIYATDNAAGTFSSANNSSGGCAAAASSAVTPSSTAADWSGVDITDQATGYGVCTFTYELARAGGSTTGGSGLTAAQGANVAGFIQFMVSDAGQTIFANNHFEKLPVNVQVHSEIGAASL